MSGGGGYNDWESDLSSIIEKTNQNLKLLRRIGDKRSDLGSSTGSYDVSTTGARPATSSAAQIASEMRSFASSISNRYAAEDAAATSSGRHRHASTTAIPRASSAGPSSSSSRKLHRSSSVEVDARARARESLIIRPAVPTQAFGATTSDGEDESDERSPRVRHAPGASSGTRASGSGGVLKRSSSLAAKSKSSATRASSSAAAYSGGGNATSYNSMPPAADGGAFDELRKSLEVHIASRSGAFEKALADLKTDVTVVASETNALGSRIQELRDSVTAKLTSAGAAANAVVEHGESIGRLEKHSAVLLGWKVGVDQDLFEISSKVKSFASIQEKVNSLEGHLEALGAAIKAANRSARHDEKIEELKDRIAVLERQAAHQLDAKAVEHTVQMRVSKEINELENRFNQSLQFLTQKIDTKLQSLEKTVQSDRIDAIASVKSELLEDIDKLESRVVKRQELTPIQNAHTQMKDDIAHVQLFFERQDKRFQELKQNSTQIRDELVETRHELTKALHAQQSRVSTTLEEKVGQLTILTKDKNAKAEQKVAVLEKRFKKVEDQCKHLHESVAKVKQDVLSRQAADTVSQQRENEKLRQRLVRSIAELEHLQTTKQELERSYETKDRQYQTKLKELRAQIEEQERLKEAVRTEMLQAIQSESRQIGVAQGRNSLLESLLAREKQDGEEKAQQVHKSRQEIAQIRQKMRSLENEVDKKMQKLSVELQTKQAQIEALTKKLARTEDEALKSTESAKREKKLLAKTRELKQQELAATKLKLREMEKVASSLAQARDVEPKSVSLATVQRDELAPRLVELELKRDELQSLLMERVAEVEELKTELKEMRSERDELVKKHSDTMDSEVKRLHSEYALKINALEQEILAKDAELAKLRESLDDKSELEALGDALALAQRDKEELLERLQAAQSDHERQLVESESSLRCTHSAEMEKLCAQIEHRVAEIAEAQQTIQESRERIATLETELKSSGDFHKQEVSRLVAELKDSKGEAERLASEMQQLSAEKALVDVKLSEMQATLESISAGDEELMEEMDNLREQYEQVNAERDRLIEGLRAKADEVAELTKLETQHRGRIAEILQEQTDSSEQLEKEIEAMRDTIERERDAAAESERQLKLTIDVLQAELDAAKQQASDGASDTSKLEAELQNIRKQLEGALQSERSLKKRLDRIMNELADMGAVSSTGREDDACLLLRAHVDSLTEKHVLELTALSSSHAQALKEAAVDQERTHSLGMQIHFLSAQVQELETSNAELKSELETRCAEYAKHAQEVGRLQDELAATRDAKHTLEEQVAELSAQVEELDASLQSQVQEKDAELDELKTSNAKLTTTVRDIRDAMERLEQDKMVQLDNLNSEIQELETALLSLNERPRATAGHAGMMEKEFFTNQQTIAAAGQSIRNLYAKLTSGCSVVELQDMKASLLATEDKHSKAHEAFQRDHHRLGDAEQEVMLNVEFLDALVKSWSTKEFAFAAKYIQAAPTLALRLGRLQELFHEAMSQCAVQPATYDVGATDGDGRCDDSEQEQDGMTAKDNLDVEDEEEIDEFDEHERSAELDDSCELGDSQDNHVAASFADEDEARSINHSLSESERCKDATSTVRDASLHESADRSDKLSVSLDLALERAESCTSLIGSPVATELSSEPFRVRGEKNDQDNDTTRTEASTTLLHSPTAALLEQRFQTIPALESRREFALSEGDDDSSVAESCTSLPNSPTGELLHEPFRPRELEAGRLGDTVRADLGVSDYRHRDGVDLTEDDASASESESDSSSPLKTESELEASRDLSLSCEAKQDDDVDDVNSRRETSTRSPSDMSETVTVRDDRERGNIDSDSEDDESGQKQARHDASEHEEEEDPGLSHDDSLSQSLELMVRLAAGEESITERDASRALTRLHQDAHHLEHESGDDLIDGEGEEHPVESDDEHASRAATENTGSAPNSLEVPVSASHEQHDVSDRMVASDEDEDGDAKCLSGPFTSVVTTSAARHHSPGSLEDNDFDEEEVSELEDSFARSTADDDERPDITESSSHAKPSDGMAGVDKTEPLTPSAAELVHDLQSHRDDSVEREGNEESGCDSASDVGDESLDLGQSRELTDSHDIDKEKYGNESSNTPVPRQNTETDSGREEGEDDNDSASEFEQSSELDSSVTHHSDGRMEETLAAFVERSLPKHDLEEGVDDALSQSSRPPSSESSPVKPELSLGGTPNALPSIPSLPLSRLAALRTGSDDDDDELHAAQLAMDVHRRGLVNDMHDDEFDDLDADSHADSRDRVTMTGEYRVQASAAEEDGDLVEDAKSRTVGEESEDLDSIERLDAQLGGLKADFVSEQTLDLVDGSDGHHGLVDGADDSEDVEDDAHTEKLELDESHELGGDGSSFEHATTSVVDKEEQLVAKVIDHDGSTRNDVAQNLSRSGTVSQPDRVLHADDIEGVENGKETFEEQDLEESLTDSDITSPPRIPRNATFSPQSESLGRQSDPPRRGTGDDHGHVQGNLSHGSDADDDDDFDRVLRATRDSDDEDAGLEQSSSFDEDSRPTAEEQRGDVLAHADEESHEEEGEDVDERNDEGHDDAQLDEDSMDEVERLLLEHADQSMSMENASATEESRPFKSALRMDDDDDELIDSESDEDECDPLQSSVQSDADDSRDRFNSFDLDDAQGTPIDSRDGDNETIPPASTTRGDDESIHPAIPHKDEKHSTSGGVDQSSSDDDEEHSDAESLPTKKPASVFETNSVFGRDIATSSFAKAPRAALRNYDASEDEEEDGEERAAATHTPQPAAGLPRAARRQFGDSEEEDSGDEQDVAVTRAPQPVLQLAPLSGLGARARGAGGGSGSLMKALQATRGAMASSELDDDMDEVEKLMVSSQSLQRKPADRLPTAAQVPSSLTVSTKDEDFDDDDDDHGDEAAGVKSNLASSPSASGVIRDIGKEEQTVPADHEKQTELDESLIDDDDDGDDDGGHRKVDDNRFVDRDDDKVTASRIEPNISASTTEREVVLAEQSAHHHDAAELGESLIDDDDDNDGKVGERDDGDASFDDASGTFGLSFGDDVLERALAGPANSAAEPVKATTDPVSIPAPATGSRSLRKSESEEDDSDDDMSHRHRAPVSALAPPSSSLLLGQNRKLGALQPLPSLGKKPLPGPGALTRSTLRVDDDEDDMDEVERLLLEQTSMKKKGPAQSTVSAASLGSRRTNDDEEEDDEFDLGDHSAPSPLRDTNLPRTAHAEHDDEFAHFDDDEDDDNDDDDPQGSPRRQRTHAEPSASGSESQSGSAPPSPSRIPILPGSSLLTKPLGSPVRAPAASLPQPRTRMPSAARSEDDGADAYLEDSFDLEESLQEDEEDV